MSPTARASSAKFAIDKSTLTKVLESTGNIVKTVNLLSTSQQSETFVRPVPFDMHHGVIGGTPLCTTKTSQTLKAAVVNPGRPEAIPWSGGITANDKSIDRPVIAKLKTASTSLDGEPVKSGQKCKTDNDKNSSQVEGIDQTLDGSKTPPLVKGDLAVHLRRLGPGVEGSLP